MDDEIGLKLKYFVKLKNNAHRRTLNRLIQSQTVLELYKGAYKNAKKIFEKWKNFEPKNSQNLAKTPLFHQK